jgi:hypothetical protein
MILIAKIETGEGSGEIEGSISRRHPLREAVGAGLPEEDFSLERLLELTPDCLHYSADSDF